MAGLRRVSQSLQGWPQELSFAGLGGMGGRVGTGEGLCCNACYVHIEVCHGRVFPQLWPPATETLLLGALQHRDTVSRSAARADVSSLCFTGLTWAETAQE